MGATVLIADDHELVRTGIRRLLEDLGCRVIGEVGDGKEAVTRVRVEKPDVALLDIHMPGIGGLEATRKIRYVHPDCRIVILTAYTEGPLPRALLEAGIDGFLTKGCTLEEMQQALTRVRRGERYISHDVAQKMALAAMEGESDSPFDRLTPRELQVALMLLAGGINRSIADSLQLSPKTVTTYRQRILRKTGVRSQTDLLRLAIRYNIAIPDDVPVAE